MSNEVISTRLYFELLQRQDNLTEEEIQEMTNYSNYIDKLFKYNEYLLPNVKKELEKYKQEVYKLSIYSEEHPESLTELQYKEFDKYKNAMNVLNDNFKVRTLVKENDSAGFANAFLITGTIILAGILFGASLFFFL